MKRAYREHPYRWTTIGDPEHIMAARDEEFQEFYDSFYVPNNAVLVVAGDIDEAEAQQLVKKYYNDIPSARERFIVHLLLSRHWGQKYATQFSIISRCHWYCKPTVCLPWEQPTIMLSRCWVLCYRADKAHAYIKSWWTKSSWLWRWVLFPCPSTNHPAMP